MNKLHFKHLLNTLLVFSAGPMVVAAELSLPQFPLQITKYVEPNVMLLLDTSGSMGTREGGETRLDIVKEIATNLVQTNKNIRFCLARFRYDQGGTILSECGSSVENINDIVDKISKLPASGATPLAEAYYEVINYFAGEAPKYINRPGDHWYNDNSIYVPRISGKYVSPIQYRCQKNYSIVMTDGTPQLDTYFPDFPTPRKVYNVNSRYGVAVGNDGNYDQKNSGIYADGGNTAGERYWGVYQYLDDVAKYAWDVDLRRTGVNNAVTDDAGKSFDDTTNANEFYKQNLNTYTVGFTLDIPMLRSAADYGKGGTGNGDYNNDGIVDVADAAADHYYQANNKQELVEAFQKALDEISSENRSTAAPTSSSDQLTTELSIFQTRFKNNAWTGELVAYKIVQNAAGDYVLQEDWVAPAGFPAPWTSRVINTGINGGNALEWNNLSDPQKTDWFGGTTDVDKHRFDYIRGKTSALIGLTGYRTRESLMGDIINSSPVFVAPPMTQSYSTENDDFNSSYANFVETNKSRADMIYVGANDGMLHGFDASGIEKMTYVPSKVFSSLLEFSQPDYNHLFSVDGSPTVANVYAPFDGINNSWKTLLVGGLRRGGQGIYALDITDPTSFVDGSDDEDNARSAAMLQWEFSDDTTLAGLSTDDKYTGDVDLGYTYSQPQIFRLNDGNYYVAVGNGYNNTEADGHQSSTGEAVLYLLNVVTGAVVKKITTGYGTSKDPSKDPLKEPLNNGLATVKGYDAGTSTAGDIGGAADGKIDFIYAGDLFGNLWKFDLSSVDPNDWGYIAEEDVNNDLEPQRNPMKLFSAKDSDDNPQPITVQPAVHTLNSGQIMVYFGTGKLLEYADTQAVNISPQSFYAIADESSITARSELLEQKILYQGTISFDGITKEVRATTENTRTTHKGWFIDLKKPVYDASNQLSHIQEGEQIVVGARVLDNVVYFVTNFADQDPCLSPINKNFLMSFSVKSGAPLDEVLIDIDEDGVMDADDKFSYINEAGESINAVVSGSTGFGSQLPTFVKTGDVKNDGSEIGFMIDKDGKMVKMQSTSKVWNRLSWREIRTE